MNIENQHIVVVGLARSGLAVARFLKARGARVTVTDQADETALGSVVSEARELNVTLALGGHGDDIFAPAGMVVLSPGVPHTLAPLARVRKRGIPVIGEVELASRFIQAPIVAVTGTNGKTTTTELLGRMLTASGLNVFVGGNIGNPLIEAVDCHTPPDVVVAEISSFQLDTIQTFRPHVAVLLNISPDHLDRYSDITAYAASKGRVFANQGPEDFAVCHGNDPLVQQQCGTTDARVLNFFVEPPQNGQPGEGAIITPKQIAIAIPGMLKGRIGLARVGLIGPHNRENIAAAGLAALAAGGSLDGIQNALDEFKALAHRLEPVGRVGGVRFVNDSKATNVDAVARALECFSRPVVLIMGGRNKGYDFSALDRQVRKHVKKLIVIGESRHQISEALGQAPQQGVEEASDLAAAVQQAFAAAGSGDTVLLSPACASFDMFGSYAERGDTFRQLVGALS